MKENHLFADIHVIQTLPPSNVNRDDTGSPKTAIYGGVNRARVSSQSWKSAMREYFINKSSEELGVRSLSVIKYVAEKIIALEPSITEDTALKMAEKIFNDVGIKTKDHKTKALFFLGSKQADLLAAAAIRGETDKNELKKLFCDNPAVDIALFGRMVADVPSLDEDASAQVANAISTHEVQTEYDYFTAADDLAPEDNAGAGMIGTIEFNSSTLYRYANVALHELSKQLGDKEQAIAAAKLFIEAFANSMPTGKSNTFANQTLPQMLMVNIRCDRPVNLVTAFEKPVKSHEGNVVDSVERLFDEVTRTEKFVQTPLKTLYVLCTDNARPTWGSEENNLQALLDDFSKNAKELL